MDRMISNMGFIVISLVLVALFGYALYYNLNKTIQAKRAAKNKAKECAKEKAKIARRNYTDYFWKDHMTFSWVSLFFGFSILFGFATKSTLGIIFSIILIFLFIFFLKFAITSYKNFEEKAKIRIDNFEAQIRSSKSLLTEITFNHLLMKMMPLTPTSKCLNFLPLSKKYHFLH